MHAGKHEVHLKKTYLINWTWETSSNTSLLPLKTAWQHLRVVHMFQNNRIVQVEGNDGNLLCTYKPGILRALFKKKKHNITVQRSSACYSKFFYHQCVQVVQTREEEVRRGVLQGLCWSTELNPFVNDLENEAISGLTKLLTLRRGCKDEGTLKNHWKT